MGEPQETRHLWLHNHDAVLSPEWSIHSAAATHNYTFIWGMAGENADRELLRNAGRIRIPVTLMRAGQDALVLPEGFDAFCRRAPQTRVIVYEDSRHEIFNALDETRIRYFRDVLDTLEGYLKNEKDGK